MSKYFPISVSPVASPAGTTGPARNTRVLAPLREHGVVRAHRAQRRAAGVGVPGFLFQFAERGGFRLLAVADGPGGEFEHADLEVLADEDEVLVGGNGDDHDAGRVSPQ